MAERAVTVAVLGAGSLFGQGLIKALKMSSLEHRLIALDAFPHAVGLYWAQAAYVLPDVLSPRVTEQEYLGRLAQILTDERADVLLVATDFDVPRLAAHRQAIEAATRCRMIVSPPEVIEIADDKWKTYEFLKSHHLPCPPSLIDAGLLDQFVARYGFPLVVKPRRGARSRGMSLVRDSSELPAALKGAGPSPIVQVAVGAPESEYTCGAVVIDGECLGAIAMRRDLRDGNTFRAYVQPEPALEALTKRLALALRPQGPVNFQLRIGAEGPAVFEINARFSGTTVIRAMAGFNEVEALVRWAAFGERMALVRQRSGVVLRYWEEMFLDWEEYERMGGVSGR